MVSLVRFAGRCRLAFFLLAAAALVCLPTTSGAVEPASPPAGWGLVGAPGAGVRLDKQNTYREQASLHLHAAGWAQVLQEISAANYRGHRVMFRGVAKVEKMPAGALMYVRVDGPGTSEFASATTEKQSVKFSGTTDWRNFSLVVNVPKQAQDLLLGLAANGPGDLWVADMEFKVVDNNVPLSPEESGMDQPGNVQRRPARWSNGWSIVSNDLSAYQASTATPVDLKTPAYFVNGNPHQERGQATPWAALEQEMDATPYQGSMLSLATRLKAVGVSRGMLSAHTEDAAGALLTKAQSSHDLRKDVSWTDETVHLQIPKNAVKLVISVSLVGGGELWCTGFKPTFDNDYKPRENERTVVLPRAPLSLRF